MERSIEEKPRQRSCKTVKSRNILRTRGRKSSVTSIKAACPFIVRVGLRTARNSAHKNITALKFQLFRENICIRNE